MSPVICVPWAFTVRVAVVGEMRARCHDVLTSRFAFVPIDLDR